MPENLIGVDLSLPVPVVMSAAGCKAFPRMQKRFGVARNPYYEAPNYVMVKRDNQKGFQLWSRLYWRLTNVC